MRRLRIGMAQINSTVGDMEGNTAKILRFAQEARSMGVEIIAFPELAITGYPPEDLLLKPQFVDYNREQLQRIIEGSQGIAIIVGFVDANDDLYNAAALIHDGRLVGVYHKVYLPNYGVFDEDRYFGAGRECPVFMVSGVGVGVNICEDMWYATGPTTLQVRAGAEVIVNINASPYHAGRVAFREKMLATRASDEVIIFLLLT